MFNDYVVVSVLIYVAVCMYVCVYVCFVYFFCVWLEIGATHVGFIFCSYTSQKF